MKIRAGGSALDNDGNQNILFIKDYISKHISQIKVMDIEGTYLLWLDMSALQLEQSELMEFLNQKAHLWFNDGSIFGASGKGYVRMNCATQREILKQALEQLKNAINQ